MESRLGIVSSESHLYKDQHAKGLELLSCMECDVLGGMHPKRITTRFGRPSYAESEFDFNISHARNLVICTMAQGKTGCDIEHSSRKVNSAVAEKFFHPQELDCMANANSEEERRKMFLKLWVLKESHLKLLGSSIANIKETPPFLIADNRILCPPETPFYYSLYEGGGYVMAAAFESKKNRDSLILLKYGDVPDFTLTAVN